MRLWAVVLMGLAVAGPGEGQGRTDLDAQPCWRAGAGVTTRCVRTMTARVAAGGVTRGELLEILAAGSGGAAGASVADFLVEVARSRELDEVEQSAYIALAARLSGDRNRERALSYLAASEPLSSYNLVAMLGATRRISSERLRGALLVQIARTQGFDSVAREALSRAVGGGS